MNGLRTLSCIPVLCASAFADAKQQQAEPTEAVETRVMLSSPGTLVVDRGTIDFVAVGDAVLLHLKDGTKCAGKVSQANDRSATVKLDDKGVVVPAGTRGEVAIPKSRRGKKKEPAKPAPEPKPAAKQPPPAKPGEAQPKPPVAPPAKGDAPPKTDAQAETPSPAAASDTSGANPPAHPAWQNPDQDFAAGMPLLSQLKPVRPDARAATTTGRLFTSGDVVRDSTHSWSNSYGRLGGEVTSENLFGDGATLHVEAELDYLDDVGGDHGVKFLPYQASYTWGGTRFDATRIEVGRFLQHGMPEFGVLDGAEWTRRLNSGSSVGASIGWMPEPDDDFHSFHDFQIAAYYHWVDDDSERFTVTGGVEKTRHEGSWDRDLIVANMRYAPDTDWSFHGTTWVDLYGSSDDQKRSAVEVTQAYLTLERHWGDAGADLSFRQQRFPEILRTGEFTPITATEIEDNHYEELSASGYSVTSRRNRLHAQVGVWNDEDENGGSADTGIEMPDLWMRGLRPDFTVFGTRGQTTTIFGGRFVTSLTTDEGRWDLTYEIANHRLHGFSSSVDDLTQQRLFLSRSFNLKGGWSASVNAGANWWDSNLSWSVGWFVQKSF